MSDGPEMRYSAHSIWRPTLLKGIIDIALADELLLPLDASK